MTMERVCDNMNCPRVWPGGLVGRRTARIVIIGFVVSLGGVFLAGCERDERGADNQPATRPAEAPQVVLTTPRDAAESVLRCLQAQRAARARDDQAAAAYYHEQLLAIAAHEAIIKQYEALIRRPASDPDETLDRFVRGWGPIVGASLDHLQFDRIRAPSQPAGVSPAGVFVFVDAGERDALLRIECVRGAGGLWRIARIDWKPTKSIATQPAANPP